MTTDQGEAMRPEPSREVPAPTPDLPDAWFAESQRAMFGGVPASTPATTAPPEGSLGWSSVRRLAFADASTAFRRAASSHVNDSRLRFAYDEAAAVLASWGEDEHRIDGPLNAQRAIDAAPATTDPLREAAQAVVEAFDHDEWGHDLTSKLDALRAALGVQS